MGEIIKFESMSERGCKDCEYLIKLDEENYMCSERVHMDDSPVMPIEQGEKSFIDWYICDGEFYKRATRARKIRREI